MEKLSTLDTIEIATFAGILAVGGILGWIWINKYGDDTIKLAWEFADIYREKLEKEKQNG